MNAKEAIDDLWKARGYLKMKPKQRKEKLGYQLDREEALGYLLTSALHMPLLSPEEATRVIGKRAGSLAVFTKLAEFQKRGTTDSLLCMSLLAEPAPLSFAPPKPKPNAKALTLTPEPTIEPTPAAPAPPLPVPPPSTPLSEAIDTHTEYLHPYGRWDEDGRYVWSDDSIPGYRGTLRGDPDERFWNPKKPPCVPSDHRPLHLFNSREAAEAFALGAFSPGRVAAHDCHGRLAEGERAF